MQRQVLMITAVIVGLGFVTAWGENVVIANDTFSVAVDAEHGTLVSVRVIPMQCELIGEPRLAANFRINLPAPDYLCQYIEGEAQKADSVSASGNVIEARFSNMTTERGAFPLDLTYWITLDNDAIRFKAKLTNNSAYPVAEFWFPRLGGWTQFGNHRNALLATPNYIGCGHGASLFRGFPGGRGLGAEAAEFATNYPGMVMPWWDLYDAETDHGLYMGYEDTTFRLSTWAAHLYPTASGHPGDAWLTPEEAGGAPVGLVFSHVRYPYINQGETLESGEFVIRLHNGDWHTGALGYRAWFNEHFPFDKSQSWLRKKSAWFTSIIYQPEDRVIADYTTYDQWRRDAEACGITCFELIGWDKGGLERDYPEYVPEEKIGGLEGFRALMKSINDSGSRCLVFANYNVMDCNTSWYKSELRPLTHQDTFGNTPNWMSWGESTLTARLGLSARRHVLASAVPGFQKVLEDKLLERVRDGAHAFQIDKVVAGSALDFNPLNTAKPDVALCEGLVQGMAHLLEKCREITPDFCLASEASQDRLIPYVDVFYRNSGGCDIAPLRYVFPEWTSCQHVAAPFDYNGVNGAVLTGSVICVEPDSYQNTLANPIYQPLGKYIKEVERLRGELADYVFLGNYYDTVGGRIAEVSKNTASGQPPYQHAPSGGLVYRVHGHRETDQRVLTVANLTDSERLYFWDFASGRAESVDVYEPFQAVRTVSIQEPLAIKGQSVQILIAHETPFAENVALMMRCGLSPNEGVQAKPGFSATVEQGFTSAWGPYWLPPVYHCRAHEKEVRIRINMPANVEGVLRLYMIDPDAFYGGRKQDVCVEGSSRVVLDAFTEGRWIEIPMQSGDTQDGQVVIQIKNLNDKGNAVISLIEWVENTPAK